MSPRVVVMIITRRGATDRRWVRTVRTKQTDSG